MTLFRSITTLCGTDNIPRNILSTFMPISVNKRIGVGDQRGQRRKELLETVPRHRSCRRCEWGHTVLKRPLGALSRSMATWEKSINPGAPISNKTDTDLATRIHPHSNGIAIIPHNTQCLTASCVDCSVNSLDSISQLTARSWGCEVVGYCGFWILSGERRGRVCGLRRKLFQCLSVATASVWNRDELWLRVQALLLSEILSGGFLWVLEFESVGWEGS
jgi:hypothetical protein